MESAWRLKTRLQQCRAGVELREMAVTLIKRNCAVRLLLIAFAAGLLFTGVTPVLRASSNPSSAKTYLTIRQYEAELDRLSSAVSNLADHPDGIGALRESLPSEWIVTADGAQFEISAEWLAGSLKEIQEETVLKDRKKLCEELSAQLRKMRSEAEELSGTVQSADGASAREKLQNILSGREFQTLQGGKSWLGRIWDQFGEWIDWILEHTIGRLMESGPVRTLVLWTLIGGVFLLIAVWVVRILARMARTEAMHVEGGFSPGRNWRDWTQEVLSSARRGDYRAALHSAYWAGVYRLADSGAWHLDQARTPREYLRLLKYPAGREANLSAAEPATEAARVSALTALTRSMESSWYGYIPATQQDFESAISHLETLGCKLGSTAQTANS